MASNPFTNAATAISATQPDSELAEAARALAKQSIELATYYLEYGSPSMKLQVIKTIMPAIGRSMSDKGENEEITALRAELATLHRLVMGQSAAS